MNRLAIITVLLCASQAQAQYVNCSPSRFYALVPLGQAMMNEQISQWNAQDQYKARLLMFAVQAPTENLRRQYKINKDPFVRWAAAVEINRRWNIEQAQIRAERNHRYLDKMKEKEKPKLLKGLSK